MAFIKDNETHSVSDPDRKLKLLSVRGFSTGDKEFQIIWGDDSFSFVAKDTIHYGGERGQTPIGVDWFVGSMKIPDVLMDRKLEIMGIIKEALEAQWKWKGSPFSGEATVRFDPRLIPSVH